MPNRHSQKYTRYVNNDNNVDDDVDESSQITNEAELEEEDAEDDQYHMQEGRRVLAMVTPRAENSSNVNKTELCRMISVVCLSAALCFIGGSLFGYLIGNKGLSEGDVLRAFNQSCSNTQAQNSSRDVPPPIPVPPPQVFDFTKGPDVKKMVSHFLSNFTPQLYKKYASKISEMDSSSVKSFIKSTLESNGLTVDEKAFLVYSSVADKKNPNTVEITMANYSIFVNNATDSLNGFQPFSAFSSNGTVFGPLVYANFASDDDFNTLEEHNVTVRGSILLIRLCDLHPGVQARKAEEKGAIGVIFYPDPSEFGGLTDNSTTGNHSLPSDGVVWQSLRMIPGDPSTPYYASQKGIFRKKTDNFDGIISIVVQPVSADTALELFGILSGPDSPAEWKGGLNTTYNFGGSFNDEHIQNVKITSNNAIIETHQHVIFAYAAADDHSKVIQVGCHYEIKDDHLTSSGIGLAGILGLSEALKATYPNGTDRLIVLSIFEGRDGDFSAGNEYSQLYSWWLETTTLAYVDMDEILEGKGFVKANVSPILRKIVRESLHQVPWVEKEGLTAYQGVINALPFHTFNPSKKDKGLMQETFNFNNPYECDEAVNFINLHGIPSLQLTAIPLNKSLKFHLKNSQYDKMDLLQRYEDEDLHWSHMIVSAMSVSVLLLAFTPLPPVKFNEIGWDLNKAWKSLVEEENESLDSLKHPIIKDLTDRISSELESFILTTESYDTWYNDGLELDGLTPLQQFRSIERRVGVFQQFGRRFLRPRSMAGHTSFGSLITYGQSLEDSCSGTSFPFIKKALKEAKKGRGSWDSLHEELSLFLSSLMDIRTDT